MESLSILGGKLRIYKRKGSDLWQCSAYIGDKNYRKSTGFENLDKAQKYAEDWYVELRGMAKMGVLKKKAEKTFKDAAEQFLKEYEVITEGERSPKWVQGNEIRLRVHLLPFFGDMPITDVTTSKVQAYRVHRMTVRDEKPTEAKDNRPHKKKAPARKTVHNEIITLRQVLKTAHRHGWIKHIPELSAPYKTQGKIVHRPWFSPVEYQQLYKATRENAKVCREQDKWAADQLHDFVLFMANTGLRPDEAYNLQHQDVAIEMDEGTGEKILVIEVRGKRGVGYCKSTANAVRPYERLRDRSRPVAATEDKPAHTVIPRPTDPVLLRDRVA